ncbi:hypothetical protein OIU77_014231 [Salix suchowensis]|uniref:Uncharacterized protein n=2 Tax=Salix TaxID=40685 RepID=A0A9Q0Z2D5_SALPP|nr:hypothetical protein OIU77_014231 [Salix suchowensis]KAJ6718889.1 hypothetical protein OIU79_006702 [Salix purpurea]
MDLFSWQQFPLYLIFFLRGPRQIGENKIRSINGSQIPVGSLLDALSFNGPSNQNPMAS